MTTASVSLPTSHSSAIEGQEEAIGIFSRLDFARLKRASCKLSLPDLYDEWLDEREGLFIGLSAAGVSVRMVTVDLLGFLEWCRQQSNAVDEVALDRYAALEAGAAEPTVQMCLVEERSEYLSSHGIGIPPEVRIFH